jgi:flagellar assembly protein FliH
MYSSKIYKSGVDVKTDDLILKQLRSPEALKELLEIKNSHETKEVDSKKRLLNLERDAYEKGFQAGENAGLKVAADKVDVIVGRVQAIYDEISVFKEKYYKENETEILSLIIAAASKVVHEELKVNNDVVVNILSGAVKSIIETENVQIRLNPEDIEYHRKNNSEFLSYLEEAKGFSIFADPKVTRGGALIESNHSEIDARVEAGINNIEKSVREAFAGEPDSH